MANLKLPRKERKRQASFSIKTGVMEVFSEYCEEKHISKSGVVEELIINYLKEKERK